MKVNATFIVAIFSVMIAHSQKIVRDNTNVIDGIRSVWTSDIPIDSKYSKPAPQIAGLIQINPINTDPSFSLFFTFRVKEPIFFRPDDYAILILEDGERLKPKYIGRIKTAGWSRDKSENFLVDLWQSDLNSLMVKKVSAIRIVTEEMNFDFDVNESEARALLRLAILMKSIK